MLIANAGSHELLHAPPPRECSPQLTFAGRTEAPQPLAAVRTGAAVQPTPAREGPKRSRQGGTVDRQDLTESALRHRFLLRESLQQRELRHIETGRTECPIVEARHGTRGAPQARARAYQIGQALSAH
jgi:hypothetical protein